MLTLEEVKEYLGISDSDSDAILNSLILSADDDLRLKVGDYEGHSELAKQYMKYWISINFTDRIGEFDGKGNSAVRNAMSNIIFALGCDNR